MKTKDKGNLGELKVLTDLVSQGLSVAQPQGDNLPFDVIAIPSTPTNKGDIMCEREMTLKEWVEKLPESHLAHREYKELIEDQELLNILQRAGVDNWEGYDIAMEEHYS